MGRRKPMKQCLIREMEKGKNKKKAREICEIKLGRKKK